MTLQLPELKLGPTYALLFLAAMVSAPAQAPVSGTITVDATTVKAQAISAIAYEGTMGSLVSVLVSDKPADHKEFLDRTRVGPGEPLVPGIFEGAWKSLFMEQTFSGFSFTVNNDGRVITNELLVGGRDDAFSLSGDDLKLELKSKAPRFAGTLRTAQPTIDNGAHKITIDLTFDVPVSPPGK